MYSDRDLDRNKKSRTSFAYSLPSNVSTASIAMDDHDHIVDTY